MKSEILLVDDDRIFNLLHTRFFEKAGVSRSLLNNFKSGEDCLAYLDGHEEAEKTIFLVFLDISMPVMDGWDFLEVLKDRHYHDNTMVVMVSSSVDDADKKRALRYEQVIDYLEKPLSPHFIKTLKEQESFKGLFRNG